MKRFITHKMSKTSSWACLATALVATGLVWCYWNLARVETLTYAEYAPKREVPGRVRLSDALTLVGLVSPSVLSYSDTKALLLRERAVTGAFTVRIYRSPLRFFRREQFTGIVIAFGDTWQATTDIRHSLVSVIAVLPRRPPPTDYAYDNLSVILVQGSEFADTNELWKTWCLAHSIPFVISGSSDRQSLESSFDALRAKLPETMEKRRLRRIVKG